MWRLKDKKGSVLYLTIVVLSLVLIISAGLSTLIFSQMKIQRGMGHSVIAFYAADTGIEMALREIYKNNNLSFSATSTVGSAVYTVESKPHDQCDQFTNYYCIKAKGTYLNTTRVIEASF